MSDATAPTDPNALLFPAFVYGEPGECRRKMKAEAKRWAKRYAQHGDFPEPKLIDVANTDPRLHRREWLKSPGFLETKLAAMKAATPDWYEDMKTGRCFPEYLAELERKYPNG